MGSDQGYSYHYRIGIGLIGLSAIYTSHLLGYSDRMGFWGFLRKSYKESAVRRLFGVARRVTNIAGFLSLGGISVVLFKASDMSLWTFFAGLGIAVAALTLIILRCAYVLSSSAFEAANSKAASARRPVIHFGNIGISEVGGDRFRLGCDKEADVQVDGATLKRAGRHGINWT
ncbi:hypothetical protein [Arthrobacter sp. W4I7]|uniref:hypothetical protein n=1 Tax=Arthrobacter sp. W4I7 TaxID=3042296 RepID=UPI002788235E|nr:hypothetical protein [Arthrobacter sp. W4I7]MDQ0689855.1 hypothetical protein [Arthrobacter sp. W4I7]